MKKRRRMSRRASKKTFKKGLKFQRRNVDPAPNRGGYRL